jgi:hypothetical protein
LDAWKALNPETIKADLLQWYAKNNRAIDCGGGVQAAEKETENLRHESSLVLSNTALQEFHQLD